jgi:6-pyruvoyltetrahydropterin/6-carboxytetrahydropterin synthase
MKKVTVIRKEHFNAAHRLHVSDWSDEQNEESFGKCNNEYYHGHNYLIEVHVKGPVDPVSGYVMDMKILKALIKEEITDPWDHKNLNIQVPEFSNINPTAENIAIVAFEKLRKRLSDEVELKVKLYETERNVVEYAGE